MKMLSWFSPVQFTYSIVLIILYLGVDQLGLALPSTHVFAILGWPTAGIALAALILRGYALTPAIFIGALLVGIIEGTPFLIASIIALGHTIEATFGKYILTRYFEFNVLFGRVRDVMGLIVAAFLASIPAATLGVFALISEKLINQTDSMFIWGAWFIGDALGILTVTPFLVRWFSRPYFTRTSGEIVEAILSIIAIVSISFVIFWQPFRGIEDIPLYYFLFLPLTWIAFRVGPRGMTLALFLVTGIALIGVSSGYGFFAEPITDMALLSLQILLVVSSILFSIFVSLEEERKEAIKKLRTHVDQLEHALEKVRLTDQAKNQLIAVLAHELRNPLAPIVSALDLIKINASISPHLIGTIDTHIRSMVRLLDDLLDLSRISRQKFKLKKEIVKLIPILIRSIETSEPLIKAKEHRFTLYNASESPLFVHADPLRLEQIFVNLINNAAKYTKTGGKIHISISEENEHIAVSIEDNGIGIESSMLKKIFEPFVQAQEQSYKNKGLGLGLSLTKELVELHDGSISAESEGKEKGSTFTVKLPAAHTPLKNTERITTTQVKNMYTENNNERKFKIIVVDDNEAAAEGLATLLKHYGHNVEIAYDGTSALSLTQKFSPDVIILDIGLPEMDGYEVARKIREDLKSPAILIALTGYGQEDDKQRAHEAGFNHHLTKPVGIADLRAALDLFT